MLPLHRTLHRLFPWRRLPCHLTSELFPSTSRPLSVTSHRSNGFISNNSRYAASAARFYGYPLYGYRCLASAAKSPATRELKESKARENKEVEFDWEYICDPKNTEEIRRNIADRKGVGDIDLVASILRFILCSYHVVLIMLFLSYCSYCFVLFMSFLLCHSYRAILIVSFCLCHYYCFVLIPGGLMEEVGSHKISGFESEFYLKFHYCLLDCTCNCNFSFM